MKAPHFLIVAGLSGFLFVSCATQQETTIATPVEPTKNTAAKKKTYSKKTTKKPYIKPQKESDVLDKIAKLEAEEKAKLEAEKAKLPPTTAVPNVPSIPGIPASKPAVTTPTVSAPSVPSAPTVSKPATPSVSLPKVKESSAPAVALPRITSPGGAIDQNSVLE